MSANKKSQQKLFTRHEVIRTVVITVLVTAAILAVVTPFGILYHRRMTATRILTEAKTALLAIHSVGLDCYGQSRTLPDPTAPYGIDREERGRILELSGVSGEVYLLQWDPKEFRADQMLYTEEGYAVYFLRDAEGVHWNVYATDPIITH